MTYIIKTQCKKALALDKTVITEEGTTVWVTTTEEGGGWITSSATSFTNGVPNDILTFFSKEKAEKFIKNWKGHPWYYVPNGNYEILEVEPKLETRIVTVGWSICE